MNIEYIVASAWLLNTEVQHETTAALLRVLATIFVQTDVYVFCASWTSGQHVINVCVELIVIKALKRNAGIRALTLFATTSAPS